MTTEMDKQIAEAYRSYVVNECIRFGISEDVMPRWTPFNMLVRMLESACRSAKWEPMSTAPRDGREILLAVQSRAGLPGKMLVGHYMQGGHCIEDHPAIDEGWYFWNGSMFDRAAKLMYWMPLPALRVETVTPPRSY